MKHINTLDVKMWNYIYLPQCFKSINTMTFKLCKFNNLEHRLGAFLTRKKIACNVQHYSNAHVVHVQFAKHYCTSDTGRISA
jgi:hypothetical protein